MIPILYAETAHSFTSNGLGRLAEATSCLVTEVRNGEYELTLTYPITGKMYNYIKEGRIIAATHDDQGDRQLFVIYRRSAPIGGLVTFYGHHISYGLNDIILDPITATSAGAALAQMERSTTPANPFTMEVDRMTSTGTFKTDVPMSVRSALGGTNGSVLDVFGGEFEWDNMRVILHAARGTNSGVTIRYGKNMTDLTQTYDELGTYDAVFPYWFQAEDGLVTIPEKFVVQEGVTNPRIAALDLTSEFQEKPEPSALKDRATTWLTANKPWVPKDNIKIKFVQLWQTEEYKDVAALQRLKLCDRVNVYYPELGIEVDNVEIIKVTYNVLLDRYDEMELGDARSTFGETLVKPVQEEIQTATQNLPTKSFMQNAIDEATEAITGGAGGVIALILDGNKRPVEFCILDTGDIDTAVNVWRWNAAGLGHSPNGYNGDYDDLAILADGSINASRILTGTMSAEHIKGGTLTLGGTTAQGPYGDGEMEVYDSNNVLIGQFSKNGIDVYHGDINLDTYSSIRIPLESNNQPFTLLINGYRGFLISDNVDDVSLSSSEMWLDRENTYVPYNGRSVNADVPFLYSKLNIESSAYYTAYFKPYECSFDLWNSTGNDRQAIFGVGDSGFSLESISGGTWINWDYSSGIIHTSGSKGRTIATEDYAVRALYCYETPTPMFGDFGEGIIGEDGLCHISFEPIFAETIDTEKYYVQLQKYGDGDCWVVERTGGYFIVKGTPGLSFGWEVKAKQKNPTYMRLDPYKRDDVEITTEDYGQLAIEHITQIKEERAA